MKNLSYLFLVVATPVLMSAGTSDLVTPQKRMATLDVARTLLTSKPVDGIVEEAIAKNPFNPVQLAPVNTGPVIEQVAVSQPTAMADREKLERISTQIKPSGMAKIGDTAILLFSQKKFKVGDTLPIVFEGVTYDIQITSIDRTSFTLRLNNEEITRPIKSVTKP